MKNKKNILIIADTQFPYDREDYLDFCKAAAKKYKCGRVIHIGDVVDALNYSNYEKDPDAPSIEEEICKVRETFKRWEKAFPTVECVIGNHDRRISRKLSQAGFSEKMLSLDHIFRHVLDFPKKWSLHEKIMVKGQLGNVYCIHGDEKGASVVPGRTMSKFGASIIRGHHHTQAYLYYHSTPHELRFDMIVGCGIDKKSVAFKYNRKDISRPIYACGVLLDGIPHLIPMHLDKDGKWDGKIL